MDAPLRIPPPPIYKPHSIKNSQLKTPNLFGNIHPVSCDFESAPLEKGRFKEWKKESLPKLTYTPMPACLSRIQRDLYRQANLALEKAAGNALLQNMKPLLEFSQMMSERYLDLYRAVVSYEHSRGIPMISLQAGLNLYDLSNSEIIALAMGSVKIKEYAISLMTEFYSMKPDQIEQKLREVRTLNLKKSANLDERLLMKIRHRLSGENTNEFQRYGYVGQNPLAYLNVVRKGQPNNPHAQFREQMYFVYRSRVLANEIMENDDLIQYTNAFLAAEGKSWRINEEFVREMNSRGPASRRPVYRYGFPAWNKFLRTRVENPIPPRLTLAQSGCVLSQRELLAKSGELSKDSIAIHRQFPMHTGSIEFRLHPSSHIAERNLAYDYVRMTEELCIPTTAGISGSMDQGFMIAGLVGYGIGENSKEELEKIKVAYLAFMVPNHDHSIHEILTTSVAYGLDYVAGPGFERYINPLEGQDFLLKLQTEQRKLGFEMPSHYLA